MLFLDKRIGFDTLSQGWFEMVVTETMLLLALRQKRWKTALGIIYELEKNQQSVFFSTLKTVIKVAESQDEKALFLLSLWTEVSWEMRK